eukprot:gene6881-7656_t
MAIRSMVLKAFIAGELIAVLASYRVWHQMNTSQDYRHWMHETYPSVLSGFYKSAEMMGAKGAREMDYKAWGINE